ncbi:MAG: DUF4270 domain-containing protein [Bacteroidales bacterium]|nr:DUF4270 domain-containing protein [Bacteroidales bacterium]
MKNRFLILAAALFCCLSCVETNSTLGGSFVPVEETYSFYTTEIELDKITMRMADNLSGYSNYRMTIGSIREPEFGLTTRGSAVSLVPLFVGDFEMGENPVFKRFHFAIARDTVSVNDPSQANILQHVRVYELSQPVEALVDYDSNKSIAHGSKSVVKGSPVFNGTDSLSFDFSEEFGRRYLQITKEDVQDIQVYLKKFPGIYMETDEPEGDGGRIDMFEVQMAYDKNSNYIMGNIASLDYSAEFDGVRKDTTLHFYYGATDFYDLDSLFQNYNGTFPQYALNYTGQDTRGREGVAQDKILVEGGGGLKPVISALDLKHAAEQAIIKAGGNPSEAIINKASLVFPFDLPENVRELDSWPIRLSPTSRIVRDEGKSIVYMGLTDSSASSENQGDVDRSLLQYAPDITYHLQELLRIDEGATDKLATQDLLSGNRDVWLLVNASETQVTVTSASKEEQEMLKYMAYSSYYNGMYGGYGGYGGYGYGGYGYGGYGYNNYLNYAMWAQQASQARTSVSKVIRLDIERFYRSSLCGPESASRKPILRLTFALPNDK